MPRPWGKLHATMLSHRKLLQLSRAERGDWLVLLLAAINSTKDDDLGTLDDVKSVLRSYGNARPGDTIEHMLNLRLLDSRNRDSHLLLHDWADHQPDDPTGAKRKAAERAAAKAAAEAALSADSPATVTGHSADSHGNVNGLSRDPLASALARGDGEETRGDSPQPPASGGRRSNGTNPRAKADAARAVAELEAKAKAWRRSQRQLAYSRGAISEAQFDAMNRDDSPLSEIPDWEQHQAELREAGPAWLATEQ